MMHSYPVIMANHAYTMTEGFARLVLDMRACLYSANIGPLTTTAPKAEHNCLAAIYSIDLHAIIARVDSADPLACNRVKTKLVEPSKMFTRFLSKHRIETRNWHAPSLNLIRKL